MARLQLITFNYITVIKYDANAEGRRIFRVPIWKISGVAKGLIKIPISTPRNLAFVKVNAALFIAVNFY